MSMISTEDDLRKEAARKRADKWRRMMTPDRNKIVGALRSRAEQVPNTRADDANLAADILDDIANGRL